MIVLQGGVVTQGEPMGIFLLVLGFPSLSYHVQLQISSYYCVQVCTIVLSHNRIMHFSMTE